MMGFRDEVEEKLREGRVGPLLGVFLYLLSILYGIGARLRFFCYRSGLLLSKKLPCKVLSIGNITSGGTGKTPVTLHIASRLAGLGHKVVILSRGYGGSGLDYGVVYDGKEVMLSPAEAGDEPVFIAEKLKERGLTVPVVVGPNRYKAGERILKEFSPEVIVLDDGFQHLALIRDLDIVLVDFKRPGAMSMLPRGLLREPPSALDRADILLLKGGGEAPPAPPRIQGGGVRPSHAFSYLPIGARALSGGDEVESGALSGRRVFLFAGIADPASFVATAEGVGAEVSGRLFFGDHHDFTKDDIDRVRRAATGAGAELLLTTEKDAVRIRGAGLAGADIYALSIKVELEDEEEFFSSIISSLKF